MIPNRITARRMLTAATAGIAPLLKRRKGSTGSVAFRSTAMNVTNETKLPRKIKNSHEEYHAKVDPPRDSADMNNARERPRVAAPLQSLNERALFILCSFRAKRMMKKETMPTGRFT